MKLIEDFFFLSQNKHNTCESALQMSFQLLIYFSVFTNRLGKTKIEISLLCGRCKNFKLLHMQTQAIDRQLKTNSDLFNSTKSTHGRYSTTITTFYPIVRYYEFICNKLLDISTKTHLYIAITY